jgi:hypothetical protein
MFCDAFEHMAQAELRVESVELRRTEQRVDSSSTFATSVRTSEQVVLATRSNVVVRYGYAALRNQMEYCC